jgi:heme a synthase
MAFPASMNHSEFSGRVDIGTAPWVVVWLWSLAALVIAMVMVGGATRLTGSGLSITQWQPISGALPPMTQADWLAAFARYQGSPQYHLLNEGMTLSAFKAIYWWEWSHRQLGRFIGLVFALGFLVGVVRRAFPWKVGVKLTAMGVLLAAQGLVGWIMVASGLEPGMTAVEPVDLAVHLLLASLFLASLVAMASADEIAPALDALARSGLPRPAGAGATALLLFSLILVQITLGALVAGSHAGLVDNTWPDMNGRIVPPFSELFAANPWWVNIFENVTLIQFDHRIVAYLVLALAVWNAIRCATAGSDTAPRRVAFLLAALVVAQLALGVATLVLAAPAPLALAHQFMAMLVLVAATRLLMLSRRRHAAARDPALAASASPLAAHVATR